LVFVGVPWLVSFVAVQKSVDFTVSFIDSDPAGTMVVTGDERAESIPLTGEFVGVEMTTPFTRIVKCSASWKEGEEATMVMKRIDHAVGKYKAFPTEATITRRISADGNSIVSTVSMLRLSDNARKEATLFLERRQDI